MAGGGTVDLIVGPNVGCIEDPPPVPVDIRVGPPSNVPCPVLPGSAQSVETVLPPVPLLDMGPWSGPVHPATPTPTNNATPLSQVWIMSPPLLYVSKSRPGGSTK